MHCGHVWCQAAEDARSALEAAVAKHAASMSTLVPGRGFMPPLYADEYTGYERAVLNSRGFQTPRQRTPKPALVTPRADHTRTEGRLTMADAARTAA